jgi:hypothetical protein
MASKAAVLRLVGAIRPLLSGAHASRLDQMLELVGNDGKAVLSEVLDSLYPKQDRDAALTGFRQFGRAVALAAEEAGVHFLIETDGQTRSAPADRVVAFKAEDRVIEEVKRLVESEIGDVERVPQDVKEERPLSCTRVSPTISLRASIYARAAPNLSTLNFDFGM